MCLINRKKLNLFINQLNLYILFNANTFIQWFILNIDNKYPFQPKTIFRCNNLKKLDLLHEYKDEEGNFKFDDIIKGLKIKYYNEISQGLELYIKLPGYTEFKIIENNNIDVIGFTNNRKNELKIDIFINTNYYYGYFFKIGENMYEFRKNGNSIIRQKIKFREIVFAHKIESYDAFSRVKFRICSNFTL